MCLPQKKVDITDRKKLFQYAAGDLRREAAAVDHIIEEYAKRFKGTSCTSIFCIALATNK